MSQIDPSKRDPADVSRLFDNISRRYDILNHVISFGLDFGLRRRIGRFAASGPHDSILDACTGTGDLAITLARFCDGDITGIDFSPAAVARARWKVARRDLDEVVTLDVGDVTALPYRADSFDVVTIAFGLRNIDEREAALREFHRVTKPGGRLLCLEFTQPESAAMRRLLPVYFRVVPALARLLGSDPRAYRYLGETVLSFPGADELKGMLGMAGWRDIWYEYAAFGTNAIHMAVA